MLGLFTKTKTEPITDDTVKALCKFASLQLSRGVTEKEIRQRLKDKKYPNAVVNDILQEAEGLNKKAFSKTEQDSSKVLKVKNAKISFDKRTILSNINLDIYSGEIVGLIGQSGCGKTTLLNLLIGFLRPDAGDIHYKNPKNGLYMSVHKYKRQLTSLFGYAPQEPSFHKRLTVKENLNHFGSLYKIKKSERHIRVDTLIKLVGLQNASDILGKNLSGGMQRRLGIACSLIHDPQIVILDEPTSDLDPIIRKDIWALIQQIHKHGKTVILTSHFLDEIEDLCNKVVLLHNSSIKAYGTPEDLIKSYSENEEVSLKLKSCDYEDIIEKINKSHLSISEIKPNGSRLSVISPKGNEILKYIVKETDEHDLEDISLRKANLGDIFEFIVGKR